MDQAVVEQVAQIFLRARQTGERLDPLATAIAPKSFVDSCAVMDAVDRLVGDDIVLEQLEIVIADDDVDAMSGRREADHVREQLAVVLADHPHARHAASCA